MKEKEHNSLIEKTIKAYMKHFDLYLKNGFVYKKDIAIYTEDLNDRTGLLRFLEGLSIVCDSLELWGLKKFKG